MDELRLIRERFRRELWCAEPPYEGAYAQQLLAQAYEAAPGVMRWSDVDYTDATRSSWAAAEHYRRILGILLTLGEQRLGEDAEYCRSIVALLRGWTDIDPRNPNWWHNSIGTPMNIANIILMLYPVLDFDTVSSALPILQRGSGAHNKDIFTRWTGANLIWGAMNTVRYALITEDCELLALAAEGICREIRIGEDEGIQEDGAFFQHGRRLYSGGYGRSFAADIAFAAYVLNGTAYALPREHMDIFLIHVLDGLRYMTKNGVLDYAAAGREMTRRGALRAGSIVNSLDRLIAIEDVPRREELIAYRAEISGASMPDATRYYPTAAMLCHHFDGMYVGAKLLNATTLGAEKCNNEGELCYNMSYGTHITVMRDGFEYLDIAPVWDYSRIPGTVALREDDAALYSRTGWERNILTTGHSGGMGGNGYGIVYEKCEHSGISLFVTDFAIPHGFVSLGAQIICTDGQPSLTLDQCLSRGDAVAAEGSVIHNGVRYTPLDGKELTFTADTVRGSWRRNNFAYSDAEVTMPVFTVGIDGISGSYAYMISSAAALQPRVKVLCNSAECQAIELEDGSVLAVFHKAGTVRLGGATVFSEGGIYTEIKGG